MDRLNAYKGNKPYIFLSYSHKDTKRVMPIIHRLQQDGFRVWFDDGIDPGVEWDEYIASRVSGCGCFLALMSANYLASDNCRDELKFGRDIKKPQVLLYLESIKLPSGMAMRLGRCPSISVKGKNRIIRQLYKQEEIWVCQNDSCAWDRFRKQQKLRRFAGCVFAAAAVLTVMSTAGMLLRKEELVENASEPTVQVLPELQKTTLYNSNKCHIKVNNLEKNSNGDILLTLDVEQSGDSGDKIYFGRTYINGVSCFVVRWEESRDPDKYIYYWSRDNLREAGLENLSVSDIKVIQGLVGMNRSEQFIYYPYGKENGDLPAYTFEKDDIVLVDTGTYKLVVTDFAFDENSDISDMVSFSLECVILNQSDQSICCHTMLDEVNGYSFLTGSEDYIRTYSWIKFKDNFGIEGQESIRQIKGTFSVMDSERRESFANEAYTYYPDGDTDFVTEYRQIQENDQILMENEYLQIAVTDMYFQHNSACIQLYARNLSEEIVFLGLDNIRIGEETVIDDMFMSRYLDPGEQFLGTYRLTVSASDTQIPLLMETIVGDQYSDPILTEVLEIAPNWEIQN